MSHSFFIEKILEKNISDTLLEHEFRSSAFSSGAERFPIHTAEYLRLSEIEESRYSAILEELNSDNTVKISETLTEKEGFFSFVLSRHNGAFNQTADTVYKLILLRYPTLSSSLRIREYAVFFVGGECPEKNAAALKRFLLFSGEYREITEGEMTEEVTIPKPSGSPKKQHSISANENPELSEPFMTTQSEKALNKYIRTCDELQKCVSLPTRAGATTPYSATSYSLLENQLRELDITMDKEDAVNAQHYFLAESREPTNMELRIIDRYRSERWSHSALNTAIDVSSINDGNVQAAYNDFTEVCGELGSDPKTATLADILRAPFDLWAQTEEHTLTDFENIKQHSLVRIDERRIGIGLDTGDKKSLLAFAHESNNSRTSVDPAGGASACLGESTRKLLRIFATPYDAIRISGIAHPESCDGSDATEDAELRPDQRSLARLACDSFASYARATALPCSANFEYVSDDFVSKHLEVSAVLASIDPETVKHNLESERTIVPGDMIMLIGSRTGREGRVYNRYLKTITDPLILELQRQVGENGKAAEASEATEEADSQETVISEPQINAESVDIGNLGHSHSGIQRAEIVYRENLAAQHGITLYGEAVPGGDPSMQRKLMRICADSNFRKRIKKIRDVDSSGIVTAVSTLAKGVSIYLDCIPLKYNGLVATEAAFSETCERMVLVVSESDAANVTEICNREGVICAGIGTVTGDGHLSVYASGEKIAYLSTDFLLNSKPERRSEVQVELPADLPDSEALEIALRPMEESKRKYWFFSKRQPDHIGAYEHLAISAGLRACVRKRRFDNTLNGTSVFSPMSDGLSSAAISYICDGSGILTKPVK
ncbi:MAG: hypothetical protein IKB34_06215, partial [Clostridia bacterium]|nr:hypothetical protein [Clostridia bacterium]